MPTTNPCMICDEHHGDCMPPEEDAGSVFLNFPEHYPWFLNGMLENETPAVRRVMVDVYLRALVPMTFREGGVLLLAEYLPFDVFSRAVQQMFLREDA